MSEIEFDDTREESLSDSKKPKTSSFNINDARGLAIEGGGVSGLTYAGFLQAWEESGRSLSQWTHIAGSSAGAILACFIAVRAPLSWMEETLRKTDFNEFKDSSWNILEDLWELKNNYGWYDGKTLEKWLEACLFETTGIKKITFAQAYEKYGTHLILTKTDVLYPRCKLVTMDHISHPDMTLAKAARTSSSIPIFFEAVKGKGPEKDHIFVDGGVLLNYPIELLKPHLPDSQIMGIYLTSARELSENDGTLEYRPITGYVEFLKTIAKTWREQAMSRHISPDDWLRTCNIETTVKATEFSLSKERQDYTINQGLDRGREFIRQFSHGKYFV